MKNGGLNPIFSAKIMNGGLKSQNFPQNLHPCLYPSFKNTPFSRILDEENIPLPTEIANFEVQLSIPH